MNSFYQKLKFTVDYIFSTWNCHWIESWFTGRKLNTGLYVNYTSFVPWTPWNTWIRILVKHAFRICLSNETSDELKINKNFAASNDFPKYIANNILRRTIQVHKDKSEPNLTAKQKELVVIYFRFPYYEDKGWHLLKFYIRKIKVNCKNNQSVVFTILYVCKM